MNQGAPVENPRLSVFLHDVSQWPGPYLAFDELRRHREPAAVRQPVAALCSGTINDIAENGFVR
jgi:hypothetical protein